MSVAGGVVDFPASVSPAYTVSRWRRPLVCEGGRQAGPYARYVAVTSYGEPNGSAPLPMIWTSLPLVEKLVESENVQVPPDWPWNPRRQKSGVDATAEVGAPW